MNKMLITALLITSAYAATANAAWWIKISEQRLPSGDVICQWKTGGWGSDIRYTTTAGPGYCPRPN
jgi:hypothetical protein